MTRQDFTLPSPVLALGSSGSWCSVGLAWPGASPGAEPRHACLSERADNNHARRLLPMARSLLQQAGMALQDVGLIAFDAGPGSFTGLRIGCGLAQGLALGLDCPVVGLSSLSALAWPWRGQPIISAIDARMGEVYWAVWEADRNPREAPAQGFEVGPPQRLADCIRQRLTLRAPGWILVGDAFARYPDLAAQAMALGGRVLPERFPTADALLEMAIEAWQHGALGQADQAAPIYVRDKVALDVQEQAALRLSRQLLS